jgi:hypothetical protein
MACGMFRRNVTPSSSGSNHAKSKKQIESSELLGFWALSSGNIKNKGA